jgi:hypothetical protein
VDFFEKWLIEIVLLLKSGSRRHEMRVEPIRQVVSLGNKRLTVISAVQVGHTNRLCHSDNLNWQLGNVY